MSSTQTEQSFVEVHDEPRHRFRYRNDFAYLYDVLIPPGDITLYHRHTEDTLYVAIGDVHVCNQALGAEPQDGTVAKGTTMVMPHRTKPLIHQVTNQGDEAMRLIGAEVLASPPVTSDTPLEASGITLEADKPRLRAYRVKLEPGETTGPLTCNFSGLLIVISGGTLQIDGDAPRVLSLDPAAFIWHNGPVQQSFTNVGGAPFEAVMGEWR